MDALLGQYLLHEVSNINMDFVNQLTTQVKKHDICNFVTKFVCNHALTDNIWFLQQLKAFYALMEACKPSDKDKLCKICYAMLHLVGACDKTTFIFHKVDDVATSFVDDINALLYNSSHAEFPELVQLKDILCDDVYNLISILYDNFLYSVESKTSLQQCFFIVRYLLTMTPKQFLATGRSGKGVNMDIMDFIFLTCILYAGNVHCTEELRGYITTCKDIFYYKAKKKDKFSRVNILFYTVYVIINKKVSVQPLDYEGMNIHMNHKESDRKAITHEQTCQDEIHVKANQAKQYQREVSKKAILDDAELARKLRYLYIYTEQDNETTMTVQIEKERRQMMSKLMRSATKEIEVDALLTREPRDLVSVCKLQPNHTGM